MAKQRKPKPAATTRPAPRKPGTSPAFKAFYMKFVPSAMHHALRSTDFSTAQLVTQALAWTFWQSGVEGAEAAATLTEPPAHVLRAMIRTEIVAEWRRSRHTMRAPRGPRGGSPTSPEGAAIARYLACTLSPREEADFEARLERDGEFFELVAPVVMTWRPTTGRPLRPGNDGGAALGLVPGQTRRKGAGGATSEWWRDYRMPERGVELMWAGFCEEVGSG